MLTGDLGRSYYGAHTVDLLRLVLPYTLLVFFMGTVVAFLVGQWIGKVTAWHGPGPLSNTAVVSGIALYTAFPPWLAFLVTYFLFRQKRFSPILYDSFRSGLHADPFATHRLLWQSSSLAPQEVMTRMLVAAFAIIILLVTVKALL